MAETNDISMCQAPGCTDKRAYGRRMYCEKHYMRLRRRGSFDRQQTKDRYMHSGGYVIARDAIHPLSRNGLLFEHRKVLHDVIGEGPIACHWCSRAVDWQSLHVDHLNEDKTDNRPENLAPSCPACNQRRGRHKMVRQMRTRHAAHLTLDGKTQTLGVWAAEIGISRSALQFRLKSGWSVRSALTVPRINRGSQPSAKRLARDRVFIHLDKPADESPSVLRQTGMEKASSS
jgi:hypothetical protein